MVSCISRTRDFWPKTLAKRCGLYTSLYGNWHLLVIYWQSQYYVDLYLPFRLHSAPYLFNQLSDAMEWILNNNYNLRNVIHILNDFFITEASRQQCLSSFSTLLSFFMSVCATIVVSTTLGPSQVLEFMGIELNCTHGGPTSQGQTPLHPGTLKRHTLEDLS